MDSFPKVYFIEGNIGTGKTTFCKQIENLNLDEVQVIYEPVDEWMQTIDKDGKNILEHFFKFHDPTTLNSQGPDFGTQYRSEIFYNNNEQKNISLAFIDKLNKKFNSKIVTKVSEIKNYTKAEEYHQKYLEKNRY